MCASLSCGPWGNLHNRGDWYIVLVVLLPAGSVSSSSSLSMITSDQIRASLGFGVSVYSVVPIIPRCYGLPLLPDLPRDHHCDLIRGDEAEGNKGILASYVCARKQSLSASAHWSTGLNKLASLYRKSLPKIHNAATEILIGVRRWWSARSEYTLIVIKLHKHF